MLLVAGLAVALVDEQDGTVVMAVPDASPDRLIQRPGVAVAHPSEFPDLQM